MQTRAIKTRERILCEASRLFALKGFHDTKLDEVLKATRVTSGAFFHHFSNKDALGFAVIDRHMEQRRLELDRIESEMAPARSDDPLQQVFRRLDAVREMVAHRKLKKGGCVIGNLSMTLADTHPAFRKRLAECFDEMASEFTPHLDEANRQRRKKLRVDTAELARYIVTIIEGALMLSRTQRSQPLLDQHFEYLKEHLRHMLSE
ncbi:putative HTH-type transcriptional regulator YxaF [Crateriforma conspicua]|uniref:Putative HTH-type transcriptional regulator YxaF n=1 Tax=Crateriforma conspicua TaxID=2527996 RepID=A0A5C6FR58_9PLAN|nr:TetR/AcrR family transcriptional regulator [Crateriforma conspicua]TWU62611.1 putative HTH-type transcriptional regulator YxaF [Crateriforma conspicua]